MTNENPTQPAPLTEAEVAEYALQLDAPYSDTFVSTICANHRRLIAEWRAMRAQIKDLQEAPTGVSCEPHVFEPNEGGENCRLCGNNWRESMHRTAGTEPT